MNKLSNYEILDEAGSGAYGKVFKAKNKETGQIVAVKKQVLDYVDHYGIPANVIREISSLKSFPNSPYIVKLLDVIFIYPNVLLMVFEYFPVDLERLMDTMPKGFGMDELHIKGIMYKLLKGLEAIHKKGYIHRDIKPANVLLDEDTFTLKIADLGLARSLEGHPKDLTPEMVTIYYRSPELLLKDTKYTFAVDVWAAGCIFGELFKLTPIFWAKKDSQLLSAIFELLGIPRDIQRKIVRSNRVDWVPAFKLGHLGHIFPRLDESGVDLLKKMLQINPMHRISARDALKHPYFDGVEALFTRDE